MKKFAAFILAGTLAILLTGMIMERGSKKTIVCFGDSITNGAKVDGHSWVYILGMEHKGVRFVNAGKNGRKTSDKEELIPVLNKHKRADVFLIFLGVNDLKDGNDSMVESCIGNVRWMIGKIRDVDPGAKIVILSPTQINVNTMSALNVSKKYNRNTERALTELEKKYRQLAVEENVGFVSLLDSVSPANYADGLHPNEAGQREIAGAVWKGLKRLFPSIAK
jgi:acyl-CoA thioesterase I